MFEWFYILFIRKRLLEGVIIVKPTIKDVAQKANVSIATVSRILNNEKGYGEETRKKVLSVIRELGYQPNAVARGLINKKTQSIGVVFPYVSNMYSGEVLSGIEEAAYKSDFSVVICNTDGQQERTLRNLKMLAEKQVDCIIFVSEMVSEETAKFLLNTSIPVLLISTKSEMYPLPYIKTDDQFAAFSAVNYLIQSGHRDIAMLAGPISDPIAGSTRIKGYTQALTSAGFPVKEENIIKVNGFSFEDGLEGYEILKNVKSQCTAVFAASDEIALGVISAAYQNHVSIPEELSIIGYDNLKLAEMAVPPLTTVAQPLKEMGKMAVEMLCDHIQSGKELNSIIMPHKIVERQSVKRY
ncbi:LacI family transcriptional regulator [Bacillus gobiensis]|uniref:LacI family transcriptional regulator n=1 Tax=Bacillus gobiensis TaxID=1441095 RepID=A0A0M4GCD5_9BACI|nr:LacI family transcriptional regulator [Bacillus gobiensis]